jgi:peptidyl-prolyl cis-trans isomerase D
MRSHKFFSVFVVSAITIMISVAFIFWGIGPKDNPEVQFVAKVEGERIMLDEYYRAYDNQYKRLKEQYSDEEIEKMNMPERVINSLIDRRVLLIAAERAGITVTEKELQDEIVNQPGFQRDGVFDVNVYENRLRLNRLSPQIYENALMSDMIIEKMSRLIGETAELSSEESKMLESIEGGNKDQLAQIFLRSKSGQAVQAYIASFRRQLDISVKREMIL